MLERIQDVLRNRKDGDKGFSLVELAVVIVIIGILVAIAIPVFANIQDSAKKSATEAAAANAASEVAALLAADTTKTPTTITAPTADGYAITVAGSGVGDFCVTAKGDKYTAKKGTATGCNSKATANTAPATP